MQGMFQKLSLSEFCNYTIIEHANFDTIFVTFWQNHLKKIRIGNAFLTACVYIFWAYSFFERIGVFQTRVRQLTS
jgi:hypothetical protein